VSDDTNAFLNESASTFEIALQEQAPLSEPLFEQAQNSLIPFLMNVLVSLTTF
jgi:hypothetical protein